MLIDAHAHLNDERLLPDIETILDKFDEYFVESAVCSGYDVLSSVKAAELSARFGRIFATVAVHPHDAKSFSEKDADIFRKLAESPGVVGIGETGLDYYYDLSPRDTQKKVFAAHLELADSLKLPVVLHIRDAYEDTLTILKDNKRYLNSGVLVHNFSGSNESMRLFDAFGCYYSFGGTLTFKNNKKGIEAFMSADKLKIILETDCPYLTPEPHRGKLNVPYYVKYVALKCAGLLNMDFEEFADLTEKNTKRLFFKMNA